MSTKKLCLRVQSARADIGDIARQFDALASGAEPSLIDVLGIAGIRQRSDFELEQLIDNRTLVGRSRRECEAELERREAARQ